ncbi:serine hydrolase domain-containing protein [Microbispora oryzae]|uniref:serine hydrolase domain-containing protein n=1 Tax=Microbispora oryzae TaxID=2806554 RepID=UPI0027DD6B65|nr:serine hydrolase domain-containing protein [Microbispora oryzae]
MFKVGAGLVPAVALPSSPAYAAAAPTLTVTGTAPSQLAALDNLMKTYIKQRNISCAQLAAVKNGKLVLARGYRYSGDTAVPAVQPTSLFRIASLSKNITAAAVLRLAQDGKVSLGAKVADLLGLSAAADSRLKNVTLWRLMQHTGGWDRDISGDYLWVDPTVAAKLGVPLPVGKSDIIKYAGGRPLDFAPGARMAYSNYGYMLLGLVIEKVSGQSYESYVKQKLLAPVGITRMRLGRTLKSQAAPGEVPYYSDYTTKTVLDASGAVVPWPYGGFNMLNHDANGGWLSSAVDLVRWARIFDAAGPALNATSITRAFAKPEIGVSTDGSWYGCGWYVRQVTGHLNTWHNGSMPGTYAYLARLQQGFTYAAIFNHREETGTLDYDVLSSQMNTAWNGVTTWPTKDLFPTYF